MAGLVTWHCPLEKVTWELSAEGVSLGDLPAGIRCLNLDGIITHPLSRQKEIPIP